MKGVAEGPTPRKISFRSVEGDAFLIYILNIMFFLLSVSTIMFSIEIYWYSKGLACIVVFHELICCTCQIASLNIFCFRQGITKINAVSFRAAENVCYFLVKYYPTSTNKTLHNAFLWDNAQTNGILKSTHRENKSVY